MRIFNPSVKATLVAIISKPWSIPIMVFTGTTLTVAICGSDMAFVREDVMWINILRDYGPINAINVFLNGIQSEFISDFPAQLHKITSLGSQRRFDLSSGCGVNQEEVCSTGVICLLLSKCSCTHRELVVSPYSNLG